jgi:hypothetical protein
MHMRERLGVRLYEDWKRLPRARRREVRAAVAEGRAVRDPRDAELTARLAKSVHAELVEAGEPESLWARAAKPFLVVLWLLAAAGGIFLAIEHGNPFLLLAAALPALEWLLVRRGRRDFPTRLTNTANAQQLNEALIPEDAFRGA